jgi:hypothetical protein
MAAATSAMHYSRGPLVRRGAKAIETGNGPNSIARPRGLTLLLWSLSRPPNGHCALTGKIAGTSPAMTVLAATSFASVTSCVFGWSAFVVETTRSPLDVLIPPRRALERSEKEDSGKTENYFWRDFLGISQFPGASLTPHGGV